MASSTRSVTGLAIITGVMVSVLAGLGAWQLQRLGMKAEMLRNIEQRIAVAPVALPAETRWAASQSEFDYLKVSVSGVFRHDQEAYLFGVIDKNNRGENIPGYFVFTPLVLDTGAILIVNRGFVPQSYKEPQTRVQAQVEGRVTLTGLLRIPERQGLFTPDADRSKRVLYARDPALIASWFDLKTTAPFTLDVDAKANAGGWPLGGQTIISVPNNHLQYAITWFSLGLVTAAMFAFYVVKRRKGEPD